MRRVYAVPYCTTSIPPNGSLYDLYLRQSLTYQRSDQAEADSKETVLLHTYSELKELT